MMKYSGFHVVAELEEKALEISGAKSKRILYTRALEFCVKNAVKFEREFEEYDKVKIKDLLRR